MNAAEALKITLEAKQRLADEEKAGEAKRLAEFESAVQRLTDAFEKHLRDQITRQANEGKQRTILETQYYPAEDEAFARVRVRLREDDFNVLHDTYVDSEKESVRYTRLTVSW